MRGATCLVTGGAGFIGSELVRALLAEGARVRVLDDFSTGREENLQGVAEQIEVLRADLADGEALERACDGVEVIFHLAAIASVPRSVSEPLRTDAVNLGGSLRVLEGARRAGCRRVVLASSSAVYGDAGGVAPRHESDPPDPRSPYAVQKLAAEHYLRAFGGLHGIETVSLRYFNVYGARQDPKSDYAAVVPLFLSAALRGEPLHVYDDGEQTRDFVHVSDVARANLAAARVPGADGRVVNVASGRETSVNALVAALGACLERELEVVHEPPREGDVRRSVADVGRARDWLGWAPEVDLTEGLRRTLDAWREAGTR